MVSRCLFLPQPFWYSVNHKAKSHLWLQQPLIWQGIQWRKFDISKIRADIKDTFHIPLQDNYRLWFGTYSGNAGDALSGGSSFEDQWSASHRGMQFTTSDEDHDRFLAGNCALESSGGWWFNRYGKQLILLSLWKYEQGVGGSSAKSTCLPCSRWRLLLAHATSHS